MVVRVNVEKMKVTGKLAVGGAPIDVKLAPGGSVFYVANQGRSGVSIVDPIRMKEIRFLRAGTGAHGLAVSRDARSLYVGNRLAGSISVIDLRRRRVRDTWPIGGSPDMLQVSPGGRQLWASGRFHSSVYVVDTRTGRLLRTIGAGAGAHGLTYFPQPGRFSVGHNGVYR
jgi:DNA-binding beta-propeller fold protein YncE